MLKGITKQFIPNISYFLPSLHGIRALKILVQTQIASAIGLRCQSRCVARLTFIPSVSLPSQNQCSSPRSSIIHLSGDHYGDNLSSFEKKKRYKNSPPYIGTGLIRKISTTPKNSSYNRGTKLAHCCRFASIYGYWLAPEMTHSHSPLLHNTPSEQSRGQVAPINQSSLQQCANMS